MNHGPYSHSRIQKGRCPLSFKRSYIDKVETPDSPYAGFGKSFHEIVAHVIKSTISDQAYDLFGESGLIRQHMPISLSSMMMDMVNCFNLFRERFPVNKDTIVGVEEAIAVDEFGNECAWDDAFLRGVLDVIEIDGDTVTVTDHKTQFQILNDDDMAKHEQLTMYCYLAACMYPQISKFRVQIYFARYGAFRRSTRTLDDLEKFEAITRERINQIESVEEWVAIPGQQCVYCDHMNECPLAKYKATSTQIPEVITPDQVVEMSRLLVVREEQVKRIKRALQEHCSAHGAIEFADKQFLGYVGTETQAWSPAELAKVLDENDKDITDYVNVSATSIRKLIRQAARLDPGLADEINAIAKDVKKTTFKRH